MDNDQRLREMAALREAAETKTRLLLTRLGRTKLEDTLVGSEKGIRAVMQRAGLVSRLDVPVLIAAQIAQRRLMVAGVEAAIIWSSAYQF